MKGVSPLLLGPLEHLTPLSDAQACTLSLIFTASYVGSIYFTNIFAQRSGTASTQRANAAAKPSVGRSKTSIGGPGVPPIAATDTDGRVIPVGEEGDEGAQNPKGRAADPDAPKVGDRDHPDTIKRRVVGVSLATGLSLGAVWYVIAVQGSTSLGDADPEESSSFKQAASTLTLLGLSPSYFTTLAHIVSAGDLKSISMALLPYALAPSMMLGPLYAMYLDGDLPLQGPATFGDGGSSGLKGRLRRWYGEWTWIETRNYVAGPISEELTFRSCLLATAILAKQSPRWLVFGSPLYFGIAHAHHAWNVYTKGRKQGQGVVGALIPAIAGCVFQLTYTSLFGFFATYTHIRTGSVWPAIASHVFCNIMGIYLPTAALARHPKRAKSIWLAYLGGIAGFVWGIRRL